MLVFTGFFMSFKCTDQEKHCILYNYNRGLLSCSIESLKKIGTMAPSNSFLFRKTATLEEKVVLHISCYGRLDKPATNTL